MDDRALHTNPVLTEIVRNGVLAVTEEMKTNLMRTAYNRVIYEGLDFTVGLFTATGETISIALGLPMFVRGMAETVKAKIAHFGPQGLEPGDIIATNDAEVTGSHLFHMTLTQPIFHQGELVGFAACMGHWNDIGGVLDGVTKDIYSEGLQIPILKAQRRGVPNEDLLDIIKRNVRHPDKAMGDWRAQLIAVGTGERRFLELIERHGRGPVLGSVAKILDQSEALARDGAKGIPDGVYEAESFMDDDGINLGTPVPIRVKIVVEKGEVTIDLSAVSPQVKGFFNSGESTGRGCAELAFKCLTSPHDFPINDGSFRPLKVILPKGTAVSAVRPAPMRWWMTYPMTVVDTIFKALAPAIPERVICGHNADLDVAKMNWQQDGVTQLTYVSTNGGWGAKHNEDGMCTTVCINDGDTHRAPVEQIESKVPLIIERYELDPDSGGAGRQRGGLGAEQVVRVLYDYTLNIQIERHQCAPWGLEDGLPGASNTVRLRRGGEVKTIEGNAKVLGTALKKNDAFFVRSGGGGGFGSPLDRDVDLVEHDVRQGYVTPNAARELYGVAIDPVTGKAQQPETAALRAAQGNKGSKSGSLD